MAPTDKYIAKDAAKYTKFSRSAGRMHMDDKEKFGEEDDGRDLVDKGTEAQIIGSYIDMSWLSEVLRMKLVRNQIL